MPSVYRDRDEDGERERRTHSGIVMMIWVSPAVLKKF
jgi:hypothetical protein